MDSAKMRQVLLKEWPECGTVLEVEVLCVR